MFNVSQGLSPRQAHKALEVGSLTQIMPAQIEQPQANQLSPKLEQLIEQTRRQQAEAGQKVAETAAW